MAGTGVETAGGADASGDVPGPPDYLACAGVEATVLVWLSVSWGI